LFLIYASSEPTIFKQKAEEKSNIKPSCGNQSIFLGENTLLSIHKQFKKLIQNSYQFSQWIWVSKTTSDEKVLGFAHLQPHRTKKSKREKKEKGVGERKVSKLERKEGVWWGKYEQTTERGEGGYDL